MLSPPPGEQDDLTGNPSIKLKSPLRKHKDERFRPPERTDLDITDNASLFWMGLTSLYCPKCFFFIWIILSSTREVLLVSGFYFFLVMVRFQAEAFVIISLSYPVSFLCPNPPLSYLWSFFSSPLSTKCGPSESQTAWVFTEVSLPPLFFSPSSPLICLMHIIWTPCCNTCHSRWGKAVLR